MLQGTLDVFSLDEVLGLLSGANKSGVLNINGDRGVGTISIADGQLVAGSASAAPEVTDIAEALFELLRFDQGSFSFDGDAPVSGEPHELDAVMGLAHARLTEWRSIETVVPSLDHHLSLVDSLSAGEITLDESEWTAIVAIGEGATVGVVAQRLELGEFDGSKRVKGLIERTLASLTASAPADVEPIVADLTVASSPMFETPEPAPMQLANEVTVVPVENAAVQAETGDTVTADDTVTVDDSDDVIPPMPEAPNFEAERHEAPAEPDGEIPPMPEPPAPFGDEVSLSSEFAAPITAEDVEPVPAADAPVSSFAGLDPIGSADMFEPPLRADERTNDGFVIAETPTPEPTEHEAPSFEPPTFDAAAFSVNDSADSAPLAAEGSAFAAEGSAFAAEGSAFAAEGSAFAAEGSAPTPNASDDADANETDAPAAESDVPEKGSSLLMRYLKSNG